MLSTTTGSVVPEGLASVAITQTSGAQISASPGFKWFYIDSAGQVQGPFGNVQMSGWMAAGFLPLGIELRRDCDDCFLTLADHMNLAGRVPFWDGYSLKPITRSNVAALSQTLATATGHSVVKPRWVSGTNTEVTPVNPIPSAPGTPLVPTFPTSAITGPSTTLDSNTAVAAAAAATAVLFATASQQAARMVVSGRPQSMLQPPPPAPPQQPTTVPVVPSVMEVPDASTVGKLSTGVAVSCPSPLPSAQIPMDLVNGSQEFLRLYTEAQALAAHAAKVEAERKELVEKLAVINSTAAKLLASDFSMIQNTEPACAPVELPVSSPPGWEATIPDVHTGVTKPVETETKLPEQSPDSPLVTVPDLPGVAPTDSSTDQHPLEAIVDSPTEEETPKEFVVIEPEPIADQAVPDSQNAVGGDGSAKKVGKKKNKKTKKNKLTAEQERQLAWEAEFERRKQAALERKLAEAAEARRLAEEEAALLAEEQAALAQEQARILMEQRKREAQRAKADSQLEQLRLPQSARWGTSAGSSSQVIHDAQPGSSSLLSIQAAQALEEAEQKRREALMAEQIAVQLAAAEASAATKRPQAWASVVNSDTKANKPPTKVASSRPAVVVGPTVSQPVPTKVEFPTLRVQEQADRPRPEATNARTHQGVKSAASHAPVSGKSASSATAVVSPGSGSKSATSIWDLPGDGKVDNTSGKSSKKQKKKHGNMSREAASFAAKEELAHWCESQLSSMPLSGVDLPTLVDLLCELEAADQILFH
ncbi:unnamed protein product [Echinostoma caproni]|uniref:GYF domain-containing protein n=1 Tax=Echinostoma caproni TaxID=27848 RepID=A0A183AK80_9TREM|nr:unnamed protein product [Echinostoma caproni]